MAAQSIFKQYDTNKNGYLDYAEVREFIQEIFSCSDLGHKTSIDDFLKNIFKIADENKDSCISQPELIELLMIIFERKRKN